MNNQRQGVHHLTVDEDSAGQRLDNYLMREFKGVPKTRLYRAMRKGEIRVNKGRVKADYRLVAGDLVRIPPLHRPSPTAPAPVPRYWAEQIAQRVIYEDERLLVINKPSGLAVHGGSGLSFGLIESLRQLRPDDRYLELVHRLDRDTSGLIMIARRQPFCANCIGSCARTNRQALPGSGGRQLAKEACVWWTRHWKKTSCNRVSAWCV